MDRAHEAGGRKTNIALTVFPLNADRMRLGYSYRISWGGSPIFFKFNPDLPVGAAPFVTNTAPAPGAKLQISDERWYAYAGFKTSMLLNRNPQVNEQVAVYGALAGAGVDVIPEHLRIEANGGYFDRGTNPLFFGTTEGPMGQTFTDYPVATYGGTLQISAFKGISPTQSADFALYVNDPMVTATRYFRASDLRAYGFNWLASGEFATAAPSTTLQDVRPPHNSTTTQLSYAGDINLRAQFGQHALARRLRDARSLGYILINQPSLVPYQDFPAGSQIGSELFGVVGLDAFWERIGFTGGLSVGIERPATFTPPPAGQTLTGPLQGNTGGTLTTSARRSSCATKATSRSCRRRTRQGTCCAKS